MGRGIRGSHERPKKLTTDLRKEMREELGRTISKHRVMRGLQQAELAEMIGKSYNTVTRWEEGAKPHLTPNDAVKLIEVLKLPKDSFEPFKDVIEKRSYNREKEKQIGANLKKLLDENDVNYYEFAKEFNIYPQHVYKFCDGSVEPKAPFVRKFVDYFFPGNRIKGLTYFYYGGEIPKVNGKGQEDSSTKFDLLNKEMELIKKENERLKKENEEIHQILIAIKEKVDLASNHFFK